ncbi:transcriptional regulator, GntR family [Rhizobiales bacterium GAS191]|nr:transcriptional regulator, GntR family [Rhizobiales bacterium GAS191]
MDRSLAHKRPRIARHVLMAEQLGRRIVSGELRPGSTLPNSTLLAREMSISRPAMREAIKLLAGKGLLESAPRRGTVVRPRSAWNRLDQDVLSWQMGDAPNAAFIRDLFELRRMIEPEAAAWAALRATSERLSEIESALLLMEGADARSKVSIQADVAFHRSILIASGNEFVAHFAPAIEASLTMTFGFQRRSHPDREHFIPDHRAIFDAVRRGDSEAARQAVHALLSQAEADAMEGLKLKDATS